MLAELERYCPNRSRGCLWTGPNEAVEQHLASDCVHRKEEGLEFLKNLVEQLRIDNHKLKEEAQRKDEEIHSLKVICERNSGGGGTEYIMEQLEEKEQECATLRRKLQALELSLAPHVPPNFFRPFDPDHGNSTSEGESDDNGGLSNTDNDGDVSSIGTVHRRRTTSRHDRHDRHERHDRSSRRHKKSSNRESNDSDVRRIAGLKDAKEKLEAGH
ncbi:hypothetical protein TrRE_jg9830 [Triparma retinervis]|uniref:Uncharacterized protein n=1 Tax=Triparma retinervis TaxID=2557542 RepID=A0A9W6ZF32_9STRA|nr:hypothetical protein TrRE_jg9830 [Triparma retinervis]